MTRMPIGSIVYLTSCVIRAKITAEKTMPDTPDVYGAELEIMDDRGALDLSALQGRPGPDGQPQFALRQQYDSGVTDETLPTDLTDTPADIGKYWVISMRDDKGTIISQHAKVWYGDRWKTIQMGARGPLGPLPRVRPTVRLIEPGQDSYINTGGTNAVPNWEFNLAAPAGAKGQIRPLDQFPDYDGDPPPDEYSVLMCSADKNSLGFPIWRPANVLALAPRVYSIPEEDFIEFDNTDPVDFGPGLNIGQQVRIATFHVPPQPFDWTPVVWGHVAGMRRVLVSSQQLDQTAFGQVSSRVNTFITSLTNGTLTDPTQQDVTDMVEEITGKTGLDFSLVSDLVNNVLGVADDIIADSIVVDDVVEYVQDLVAQMSIRFGIGQLEAVQDPTSIFTGLPGLNPRMRIGVKVSLGPKRRQVARGFGNGRGQVNIMPHYSSPTRRTRNITRLNNYAVVPANHTQNMVNGVETDGVGTVYVDLHNDGAFGTYSFDPQNAQLLVMVVPIDAYDTYAAPSTRRVTP